jgi:predicted permease
MPALRSLVPPTVPRGDELGIDASVFGFAAGAVAVVTMLAALAPAWRGSRLDPAAGLKRSAAATTADRSLAVWRRGLVAMQAGLASALLVTAALLLLSFSRLSSVPLGFDAADVLTVEMRLLDPQYRDDERKRTLQEDVLARVAAVPGVRAAAIASAVPFRGVDWMYNIDVPGGLDPSVGANGRHVDPAYFSIMQIALRRGRLIDPTDTAGAPSVAVVSESFARAAFGAADPIGRQIEIVERQRTTIVGVVADVRYASLARDPLPAFYVPRAQLPSELMCLLVHGSGGGADLGRAVRQAIHAVDPALPAMKLATLGDIVRDSLAERRFYTVATAMFAGLALLLTVAGLAVIVVRTIVDRRKELAIRAALGAAPARLCGHVVWQGMVPVAAGLTIGLAAAFASASALASFLFGVAPREIGVYLATGGLLLLAAGVAGWIAARGISAISPSAVLRAE